jgi:hypothetical protein
MRTGRPAASLAWAIVAAASTGTGACFFPDALAHSGATVRIHPADTLLYVGTRFRALATMVDVQGNPYASTHVAFTTPDSSVSVTREGLVTAVAYGAGRVVAYRELLEDTSWVSVVPQGTFAVSSRGDGAIHVVTADGSGLRSVGPAPWPGGGASAWLPGAAGLVYEAEAPGHAPALRLLRDDLAGHVTQLVVGGQGPRASRDGAWVYYMTDPVGGTIWRVRPDGSGAELVTTLPVASVGTGDPDPSPDGSLLVYWRHRAQDLLTSPLTVRTLSTGTERALGVPGRLPRWAPAGDRIAYWSNDTPDSLGAIWMVGADGSGARRISQDGRNYTRRGLDWSPDGQWLLARCDSSLDLIHAATGTTVPLRPFARYIYASWRW